MRRLPAGRAYAPQLRPFIHTSLLVQQTAAPPAPAPAPVIVATKKKKQQDSNPSLVTKFARWFFGEDLNDTLLNYQLPPTHQEFIVARAKWLDNIAIWLAPLLGDPDKPPCDLHKYFVYDPNQSKPSVDIRPPTSVSACVIAFASLQWMDELKKDVDTEFLNQKGFNGIALKIFLKPTRTTFNNSLDFESSAYKYISNELIKKKHTPHVISYLASFACTISDLQLGKDKAEHDYQKNKLIQRFANPRDKSTRVPVNDKTPLVILICEKAYDPYTSPIQRSGFNLKSRIKDKVFTSDKDALQVIWQVIWTLECLGNEYFRHNDLHFENIFVEDMGDEPYDFWYTDVDKRKAYMLKTRWYVKIFDFDHGALYQPTVQRNMLSDTSWACGNKDGITQKGDPHQNACNRISETYDIHGFMISFLSWHEEDYPKTGIIRHKDICSWIRSMIPSKVLDYWFPSIGVEPHGYPQQADNHEVESILRQNNLKLKTPHEYRDAFINKFAHLFQIETYSSVISSQKYLFTMNKKQLVEYRNPVLLPEDTRDFRHTATYSGLGTNFEAQAQLIPSLKPTARNDLIIKGLEERGTYTLDSNVKGQAEVELNIDITIEPLRGEYPNMMNRWKEELDQMKEIPEISYDHQLTVDRLADAFLIALRPDGKERTAFIKTIPFGHNVAFYKACWIICAPMFYGMPANFRKRVLLQAGKDVYTIYCQIFATLGKKGVIENIMIPHLHLWE